MKEIKREVQRIEEVITYESVDGKVFETKEDCEKWEKSYKGTISACMKKIPHKVVDGESCLLPNSNYDDNVWVLIPRNMEDINIINAYLNNIDSDKSNRLTQDDIEKTICINFGYNYDYYLIYKYPDFMEDIKNAFDKIETEVKENMKKENM